MLRIGGIGAYGVVAVFVKVRVGFAVYVGEAFFYFGTFAYIYRGGEVMDFSCGGVFVGYIDNLEVS